MQRYVRTSQNWYTTVLLALIVLGWVLTLAIGAIGSLILMIAGLISLPRLFYGLGRAPWTSAGFILAALCIAYFSYWVINGATHIPSEGYGSSLGRVLPVFLVGILAATRPADTADLPVRPARLYDITLFLPFVIGVILVISVFLALRYNILERRLEPTLTEFVTLYRRWDVRSGGLHGNPLIGGSALILCALIPAAYWRTFRLRLKVTYVAAIVVTLASMLIIVQSRMSLGICMLLLAPLGLWMCLSLFEGPRKRLWQAITLGVIGIGMLGSYYFLTEIWQPNSIYRILNGVEQVIGTLFQTTPTNAAADASFSTREILWQAAIATYPDAPLFGFGPQNRVQALGLEGDFATYSHLHNSYFNHLIGGGFVGLGLLLAIQGFPVWCWIYWQITRSHYWQSMESRRREELVILGFVVVLAPMLGGLTNVVMFESTLATLAIIPLVFWCWRLPSPQNLT